MQDGLYIARFRTPLDEAMGIIVLRDNEVLGGDAGMYYAGHVEDRNGRIQVNMTVRRHQEAALSVFGDFEKFDLTLTGRKAGEVYEFEGRANAAPSMKFTATLKPAKV